MYVDSFYYFTYVRVVVQLLLLLARLDMVSKAVAEVEVEVSTYLGFN